MKNFPGKSFINLTVPRMLLEKRAYFLRWPECDLTGIPCHGRVTRCTGLGVCCVS
jgi:hypothetical protein